jgi:hypothetical protein
MDTIKRIWIIRSDSDKYRAFDQEKYRSEEWMALFDRFKEGGSLIKDWQPIEMVLYEGNGSEEIETEKNKPIPDFTKGVVTLAMSSVARTILEPLIADDVEFLPLLTPRGPYYELNISRVAGLDVPNSAVIFFKESRKILKVERYAFYWDRLKEKNIFLLSELGQREWFVSDAFKQKVEESGLSGLVLFPVPLVEG